MGFRKGETGIYNCQERTAGGKLLLAFVSGFFLSVLLMFFFLRLVTDVWF